MGTSGDYKPTGLGPEPRTGTDRRGTAFSTCLRWAFANAFNGIVLVQTQQVNLSVCCGVQSLHLPVISLSQMG